MKRRYRRLEVGESLKIGDYYTAKSNPQPPESMSGMIQVTEESFMCGSVYEEDKLCYYYRFETLKPKRLIRKYRIVKDNEPVQMFDWLKLSVFHEEGLWPAPDKMHNEGWHQITSDSIFLSHLESDWCREPWTYARFVDCIPIITKGKVKEKS